MIMSSVGLGIEDIKCGRDYILVFFNCCFIVISFFMGIWVEEGCYLVNLVKSKIKRFFYEIFRMNVE